MRKKISTFTLSILFIYGFLISAIIMTASQTKAEESEPDCCSDCCRWSELFGECMSTGTSAYCLDVKYGPVCEPCVVVTPDK